MVDGVTAARTRRWADIVAIVASVVLFGFSVWGGVLAGDSSALDEVGNVGLARASTIAAGLIGVLGIFAAQKNRVWGRVMVVAAGVIALVGLFAFRVVDATAMAALGIPGIALVLAGFFVGPMPTELEERR
jgi:hypothetical protein